MTDGQWIALDQDELAALIDRLERQALLAEDIPLIVAIIQGFTRVTGALREKEISIARLRQLVFGVSTEKTAAVLKEDSKQSESEDGKKRRKPRKKKGHGRNGADAYTGATRISLVHEKLKHGDLCPCCDKGKIYKEKQPRLLIWITGKPPLHADRYEREALRCNLCGETFVVDLPQGVGPDKYDETAVSMLALMKYGSGMPFYRLEKLQESLGIPLPASTQWELLFHGADRISFVFRELLRLAAQGDVIHNDDTGMKLLAVPEPGNSEESTEGDEKDDPSRTGTFTSGIVSEVDGQKIAIYRSGRKHAGENLSDLLKERDEALPPPIQMCDGLSRNVPSEEPQTILANCVAHGRRKFVEVASCFPEECRFVLELLRDVYKNDAIAKERGLTLEERLRLHQEESAPLMEKLKKWLQAQLSEKKVEPNSSLGRAIKYMLRRWEPLTLFLRKPGAPLDNNICERMLKLAILQRKNSLFFRTMNGAAVSDLFMSLIHTCRLCGANPFDYITALLRYAHLAYADVSQWMPWNYKQALTRARDPTGG